LPFPPIPNQPYKLTMCAGGFMKEIFHRDIIWRLQRDLISLWSLFSAFLESDRRRIPQPMDFEYRTQHLACDYASKQIVEKKID
jgi:hypothetical protein